MSEAGAKIRGGHSDRDQLLQAAALSPKIHAELWDEFGTEDTLPPASALRQYLVFDREGNRFNESSVDDFIAEFLETVKFANLEGKNGSHELDTSNNGNDPKTSRGEIKVGSIVQWTSNGVDRFPNIVLGVLSGSGDPLEHLFSRHLPALEREDTEQSNVN